METRVARIISYLLHPLMLPTYSVVVLLQLPLLLSLSLGFEARMWLVILVFGFTFVLPAMAILSLYLLRVVNSLELEQSRQRTLPLLFTSVSYYALIHIFRKNGLPAYFLYILYSGLFSLLIGMIINTVFKISLHTLGWGATTMAFIGISFKLGLDMPLVIIGAILLAGIVGSCRLKLNAHTPAQVFLGYGMGVGIVFLLTLLA